MNDLEVASFLPKSGIFQLTLAKGSRLQEELVVFHSIDHSSCLMQFLRTADLHAYYVAGHAAGVEDSPLNVNSIYVSLGRHEQVKFDVKNRLNIIRQQAICHQPTIISLESI